MFITGESEKAADLKVIQRPMKNQKQYSVQGTFLAVQWLRLQTPIAGGAGSIPARGTKIPQATQCSQKKKKSVQLSFQELKC